MSTTPTRPGDPAELRCSVCGTHHTVRAPRRGRWADVECCGWESTVYWSTTRPRELRVDGYCDPVRP